METKAAIVVMSHLSDAQVESQIGDNVQVNSRINFAKYIILETGGNLNKLIDVDYYWKKFVDKTPVRLG